MKIKHYFGLAVIAAMTASCSSNEDLGTAGPGTGTNEAGVGYATFTINLPSVSGSTTSGARGTRAADNGGAEMDKGTEDEYKVSDATALIFQKYGADEGSYKFVESVTLPVTGAWEDAEEGVTKSKKLVAKLTNVDTKNTYGVLVLLNNNTASGVKIKLPTAGLSYKKWNDQILSPNLNELAKTGEFYMANAPLCESGKVTTLVTIDKDKIYSSAEKAENGTAADVYVERGVAKMTVADPGTKTVMDKATSAATKSEVKFSNWALDITNKKTFAVHNIDGLESDFGDIWKTDPSNRFIGTNNRVYWGKDPNYDNEDLKKNDATGDDLRDKEFNFITATSEINKDFTNTTITNPVYCLENTFNLTNMYQGQTTRVIFKATYTPKDADGNSLAETADGTFYTIGNMKNILKGADLEAAVNAAATSALSGCTVDYTRFKTEEGSHVITLADIKDASGVVLDGAATYGPSSKTGNDIVDEINAKLGLKAGRKEAMVGINTYLKGATYYIARVKHFGALTPWHSGESYGTDNATYLGRYGMLRNNWYELQVGNVYGPGYPGVPPVDPNQPDDENEKYLSVSVKILSWAKRTDKVDL